MSQHTPDTDDLDDALDALWGVLQLASDPGVQHVLARVLVLLEEHQAYLMAWEPAEEAESYYSLAEEPR